MPTMPKYQQSPELYMWNSDTKRHILKSSPKFRKLYREYPARFVESASMFPAPIAGPIALPLPPAPEAKVPGPHIGRPIPLARDPSPTQAELEKAQIRIEMRNLIRQELAANPAPYADKSADDLSASFRQLLLQRLGQVNPTGATPPINSRPKPGQKSAKPQYNFRLAAKPVSDDEDLNSADDYDEDE